MLNISKFLKIPLMALLVASMSSTIYAHSNVGPIEVGGTWRDEAAAAAAAAAPAPAESSSSSTSDSSTHSDPGTCAE